MVIVSNMLCLHGWQRMSLQFPQTVPVEREAGEGEGCDACLPIRLPGFFQFLDRSLRYSKEICLSFLVGLCSDNNVIKILSFYIHKDE